MSGWSFFNPTRVFFEPGSVDSIGDLVEGERIVLITSPGFTRRGVTGRVREAMGDRLVKVMDTVRSHPDLDDIDEQLVELRPLAADALVALGGGSVIDTAKALSRVLASREGVTLSEHLREGENVAERALPMVAVPTTAGTGSEVTPFATIWDKREKRKLSLEGVFPEKAVLDPILTINLPKQITICSGLDVVSHALESIWNRNASPVSIALATRALQLALKTLPELIRRMEDLSLRTSMMEASLLGGFAISQTRTALAHSMSYPLTLAFDMPHGLACSFALPEILMFNAEADDGRLEALSIDLGYGGVEELGGVLVSLLADLEVPGMLSSLIDDYDRALGMSREMLAEGRVENNIRAVHQEDVMEIIGKAFLRYRSYRG